MKAVLANEDHPNHHPPTHPPRRSLATPSYLRRKVTGARVFAGHGASICNPRCRSVHDVQHIVEQKSRSRMQRNIHGHRTTNTHDNNNTTHTPHAYQLLPTTHDVVHVQATFGSLHAPKQNDEGLVAVALGRKCHVYSTICSRLSAQAQGRRHVIRTYRLAGRINNLNFRAQVAVYVQPCS